MALTLLQSKVRRFLFQNSNGINYDVLLRHDGSGYAIKLTGSSSQGDTPKTGKTKIALTIDAGKVADAQSYHVSRFCHEAIFNTAQTLDQVLDAAS